MTEPIQRPDHRFNQEDSNTSANPEFEQVLCARLNRRHLLRGSVGLAGLGLVGGVAALAGCATRAPLSPVANALSALGFKPVAKGLADAVVVPEGYTAQILYALGDPLFANVPAFRNDGRDSQFDQRAGDHHDGMEWFGLDAQGQPSRSGATRGLIAMNHEATTDQKLSSFFLHADGGTATLPRPAAEVDKELMAHGISVVEMHQRGGRWAYNPASPYNRRVTTLSDAAIHGPARGSEHLVTKFSADGARVRGTLNNCGAGPTPWGTYVSGEENWFGYFYRDAQDDDARQKDKQVQALQRYGRKAGEASRHGWESAGKADI